MQTPSMLGETHLTRLAWYAAAASLILGGFAVYTMGRKGSGRLGVNLQTMLPAWNVTKGLAPRRPKTSKRRRKA
jgi:hypothetical protein